MPSDSSEAASWKVRIAEGPDCHRVKIRHSGGTEGREFESLWARQEAPGGGTPQSNGRCPT